MRDATSGSAHSQSCQHGGLHNSPTDAAAAAAGLHHRPASTPTGYSRRLGPEATYETHSVRRLLIQSDVKLYAVAIDTESPTGATGGPYTRCTDSRALLAWPFSASKTGFSPSYCQISTDLDKILHIPNVKNLLLYGIHLWADLDRDRCVGGSRPNQNDYGFYNTCNAP